MLAGWGADAGRLVSGAVRRPGWTRTQIDGATVAWSAADWDHAREGPTAAWLSGVVDQPAPLDARAVLEAARRRGVDALLGELDGSFLLVLVGGDRRLRVVQDRLATRGAVSSRRPGGGVAAEHTADLLAALPALPAADELALATWLSGRALPPGRTLHAGVARLRAGHVLEIADDGPRTRRSWAPRFVEPVAGDEPARLRAAVDAAVARAVRHHARPAVLLSGGLDSAIVTAAVRHAGVAAPRAYAGVFPADPSADEQDAQLATAQALGCVLHTHPVGAGRPLLAPVSEYLRRWRTPPPSPTLFLWEGLQRAVAADGHDVLLDGEGGDETLGLAPYLLADRVAAGHLLDAWRLSGRAPWLGARRDLRKRLRALRHYGLRPLTRGLDRELARAPGVLCGPRGRQLLAAHAERAADAPDGPRWWRHRVHELITAREAVDAQGHLHRTGLLAGVNRRHPLLGDADLVCAVLAQAPAAGFRRGWSRPIARDAFAGELPATVVRRRGKADFSGPVLAGLRGADGAALHDRLLQRSAPVRSYVDGQALDELLARWPAVDPAMCVDLFAIGVLDCWLTDHAG